MRVLIEVIHDIYDDSWYAVSDYYDKFKRYVGSRIVMVISKENALILIDDISPSYGLTENTYYLPTTI